MLVLSQVIVEDLHEPQKVIFKQILYLKYKLYFKYYFKMSHRYYDNNRTNKDRRLMYKSNNSLKHQVIVIFFEFFWTHEIWNFSNFISIAFEFITIKLISINIHFSNTNEQKETSMRKETLINLPLRKLIQF